MHINKIISLSTSDENNRQSSFQIDYERLDLQDKLGINLSFTENNLNSRLISSGMPSILIMGLPRSGSTLLHQLMAYFLDVGYPSNLMAYFYRNPLIGSYLHKSLITSDEIQKQELISLHGKTLGSPGTNEFGYFFTLHIPFINNNHEELDENKKKLNFLKLNETLGKMTTIHGKTFVAKCTIGSFVIDNFIDNTNAIILYIKRDRNEVIKSIQLVREERLIDPKKWWSIRPKDFEKMLSLEVKKQVEWQVSYTKSAIERQIFNQSERVIEVEYEDLKSEPTTTLKHIIQNYRNVVISKSREIISS
jgi:hypothetical protein